DYFKRQCRVSIEPDEVVANNVIEQVGSGYLVFSTDYPHVDSRYPEAVNHFLRLPLTEEDKRKILWDNCMSYYAMLGSTGPPVPALMILQHNICTTSRESFLDCIPLLAINALGGATTSSCCNWWIAVPRTELPCRLTGAFSTSPLISCLREDSWRST